MALAYPDLDDYDLRILDRLQTDARAPLREIGEQVHLSVAAVQRRIKRLERQGLIDSVTAVLNPGKIGPFTTLIVEVSLESERADLLDATRRSFLKCPHVQHCYYVTGESDFVLIINVGSMEQYEEIARDLFHENGNVRRFRTIVSLKCLRASLRVPLASRG